MVSIPLTIEIKSEEVTIYSIGSSLEIIIRPILNTVVTGIFPGILQNTTTEQSISVSEITWYQRGALVWLKTTAQHRAALNLEFQPSPLLLLGLHIRISTPTCLISAQELHFPAGSISSGGLTLYIDLSHYLYQLAHAQLGPPQLFQNFPRRVNQRTQPYIPPDPLELATRAITEHTGFIGRIRRLELLINQYREEQLFNNGTRSRTPR